MVQTLLHVGTRQYIYNLGLIERLKANICEFVIFYHKYIRLLDILKSRVFPHILPSMPSKHTFEKWSAWMKKVCLASYNKAK